MPRGLSHAPIPSDRLMRLPLLPIIIVLLAGISVDFSICRQICNSKAGRIGCAIYAVISAIVTIGMAVVVCASKKGAGDGQLYVFMWTIFTYFAFYIPKYLFVILELFRKLLVLIFKRPLKGIAIVGAMLAVVVFVLMWWGAFVTRYSIEVRNVDVAIRNLPPAFRGYRIVQLSDIHTGSFAGDPRFLEKVVEKVNSLKPDLILFTGDIVNRHSSELLPFISTLAGLNAPDGVWSVMGNHDYGEYYHWDSEADRFADIKKLKELQHDMGWQMLNNSHTVFHRGNDSIVLVGVENIGDPPFTTYGDLNRAYPRLNDPSTKILMTHNPAHWTDSIANRHDVNVALSLSGHTHGMQIRLFGWSPAAMRYPTWGGLYTDSLGHSLYVNIGLGEVGFPSRIGATPEITLITLIDKDSDPS